MSNVFKLIADARKNYRKVKYLLLNSNYNPSKPIRVNIDKLEGAIDGAEHTIMRNRGNWAREIDKAVSLNMLTLGTSGHIYIRLD